MSVTVVIPNYNGHDVLREHLPKVLAAVGAGDEVIVVDDASTDDSLQILEKEFPRVKIMKNAKNLRYAESCNRGVDAAGNESIILLNSDVSPEKDFLKHLLPHFEDAKVFAVGCLEIGAGGKESGRSTGKFEHGMLAHRRAANQDNSVTLWAAGGSMAVRKSLWKKLGGMDTLFRPAYKEDIDLSYRAWKAGYEVRFEPKSRVHHIHETTNATALGERKIQLISYKNEFLFLWKNLTDWSLLLSHTFWLVFYILPVLGWRTRGLVIQGYFMATLQFFEMIRARARVKKLWKMGDKDVIDRVGI